MSRKIKVSFEVTDNWNRGDFKKLIKDIVDDSDSFELYIISNDNSSMYIQTIGQIIGLPDDKVVIVSFRQDKIDAISNLGINIHLDNLLDVVTLVDETTDAFGILVNSIPKKYYTLPGYIVEFGRRVEEINGESN